MTDVKFSAAKRVGVKGVFYDLYHGFKMGPLWQNFALDEIQNRYRRSVLGLAWIGVSYLFFVLVIVLFFRGLSAADPLMFLVHVSIGFTAFTFMVGNITDGCDVYRSATAWIKSTSLPYSIYIYKSIFRSIFTFVIQIILAFAVIFIAGWRPQIGALMALPALLVYLVNAIWIQMLFGLFATRYRDISHLVSTVTRLLFFATPILWTLGQRGGMVQKIAYINPMTHYIEIFRAPIMGTPIIPHSWIIVIGLTLFGWAITIIASSFMSKRLPFWI